MRFARTFLLLTAATLAAGCTTLGYYAQAVGGQLDILARTRPIAELLDDTPADVESPDVAPVLAPDVKERLTTILRARDFATHALALPDNNSFRVYAQIDRAQVAWNVVATPEFSFTPKQWCFPVAGCVPYRGYFSHESAQRFSATLKQERLDVRVAGVPAYSTLGWFADPVFSSQLRRSDADIAALIFHELAHQVVYQRGDTAFNESFATTVEIEGLRRWLAQSNDATILDNARRNKARHAQFVELLLKYRARLETLYAMPLQVEPMRAAKANEFEALRAEYAVLRQQWGGHDGYDAWFAQDLNNAHLASVGLYHQYVPAFQKMLADVQGDLPAFYRLARALSKLPAAERAARFAQLGIK